MSDRWRNDLVRLRPWNAVALEKLLESPTTQREASWQEAVQRNLEASKDLDKEIAASGVPFSVGELANVKAPYQEAIPVLLRHLRMGQSYPEDVQELLFRALAVPYAGEEVRAELIRYLSSYRESLSQAALYALGIAIAEVASKVHAKQLLDIVDDPLNRDARLQPLLKLGKWKVPGVEQAAVKFLLTGVHPWFAVKALTLAKAWDQLEYVEPYSRLEDTLENSEVRKLAKKFELEARRATGH